MQQHRQDTKGLLMKLKPFPSSRNPKPVGRCILLQSQTRNPKIRVSSESSPLDLHTPNPQSMVSLSALCSTARTIPCSPVTYGLTAVDCIQWTGPKFFVALSNRFHGLGHASEDLASHCKRMGCGQMVLDSCCRFSGLGTGDRLQAEPSPS